MLTPKEGASSSTVWMHSVEYSALFDGTEDYLTYTPRVTDNPNRWTFSVWVKGVPEGGNPKTIFCATQGAGNTGDNNTGIKVTATRAISVNKWASNASQFDWLSSDDLLSDATGWYHLIVVYDSTLTAEADRIKVYVNGVRVVPVSFTAPSLNLVTDFGHSGARHVISGFEVAGRLQPFNGYIAEPRLILSQALEVAALGAFSGRVSGLWIPKEYTGSYGTNGFYLDFTDAADLGRDVSENGNDFTVEGAPAQVTDTPTNNGLTWNPLNHQLGTFGDGNKYVYVHAGVGGNAWGTLSIESGKYCFGIIFGNATENKGSIGLRPTNKNAVSYNSDLEGYVQWLRLNGVISSSTGDSAVLAPVTGTVYVFAVDADNGLFSIYADDGATLLADVTITPGLSWVPHCMTNANDVGMWSILVDPSEYIAPEGYLPLCAANLPDPEILDSARYADMVLRQGDGNPGSVDSLKFRPDFVNSKDRDNVRSWALFDSVRGAAKYIQTDVAGPELTDAQSLTSFTGSGYTLGASDVMNHAGASFVDLCLKASPEYGFEIIRYTGDGVAGRKLPHNLGRAPTFFLLKDLDSGNNWAAYHTALGATKYLRLDNIAAATDISAWNNTEPTAATITLGSGVNVDGDRYVLYAFTDSDLFKAFSYVGNNTASGQFINTGGRVLAIPFLKNASTANQWIAYDVSRSPHNPVKDFLLPSSPVAETLGDASFNTILASTGFKVAGTAPGLNGNGNTLVGLAVLESAAKYSNAY